MSTNSTRNYGFRRSVRIPGYDYSETGTYFVTVCCYEGESLFGEIIQEQMILSEYGKIVEEEWKKSALIRREITLDEFVVMPNHIHGIVVIENRVGTCGIRPCLRATTGRPYDFPKLQKNSLGSFIAGYKSAVTRRINLLSSLPQMTVWQRNYYERIVRNEEELNRIRQYIRENPLKWQYDPENSNCS